MSLTLYIGPMFAGKSSAILGTIRRNTLVGRKTLCLTSHLDKRYSTEAAIRSHDQQSHPAHAVKQLLSILGWKEFNESPCIIVEEAQFFPDLKDFVMEAVEVYSKEVIVVGLDGDSSRKPFGQVLDLIPYCDTIHKLTALCTHCGDGSPALFSYRKPAAASSAQVNVGAADQYEPLCRSHYLSALFYQQVEDHIAEALVTYTEPEVELKRCMEAFGVEHGVATFAEIIKRRPTEWNLRGQKKRSAYK